MPVILKPIDIFTTFSNSEEKVKCREIEKLLGCKVMHFCFGVANALNPVAYREDA